MSLRFRSVSRPRLGSLGALLAIATACSTGGPILTGSNPFASPTPTPATSASATPTPAATPTATPAATPTPTPVSTPGPGQSSVTILEGSIQLPAGYVGIFDPFTISQAGSVDFSADWISPLNDIDIALASGACTSSQLSAGTCTFAGLEESATLKPEQMTLALSAGSYTPLLGNFSNGDETISYRIVFTPNASASRGAASASLAAASSRAPALVKATGRFGAARR
jgi:hypothetical protein